jgi:hypothetical protein
VSEEIYECRAERQPCQAAHKTERKITRPLRR